MGRNTKHSPGFFSPRDTYDAPLTHQDLRRALPAPSAETLRARAKQKRREAAAHQRHQPRGPLDEAARFRQVAIATLLKEAGELEAQAKALEGNKTP